MRYVFEEGKPPQLFTAAMYTNADQFAKGSFMFIDEPEVHLVAWVLCEHHDKYPRNVFSHMWIKAVKVPPHLQAALLLVRRNAWPAP